MKTITNNIGNQVIIYADTFEYEAYDQIKKISNFVPYQHSKIRIMPDAHAGKGCVVGTTMTINDKITPNLVGADIGCGMLTIKFTGELNFDKLDNIIRTKVPHGFNIHTKTQVRVDFRGLRCTNKIDIKRAVYAVGSLGGGNHFLEVGKSDTSGETYLIIHSGSRKFGNDICKYYQDKAFQTVNEMSKIKETLIKKLKKEGREQDITIELKKVQKPSADKELAYLEGSDFDDYMNDMNIAQEYAILNRSTIAKIILTEMGWKEINRFETIHNYIDFNKMILRKGAVSADKDELLLIPINMRDGSLLCKGKGNADWNYSAPHGAGRLMSRSKAKELLNLDDFKETMKHIYTTSVCTSTLDEAPDAYKSIDEIKTLITDTVDVIDVIKPLYNFKSC